MKRKELKTLPIRHHQKKRWKANRNNLSSLLKRRRKLNSQPKQNKSRKKRNPKKSLQKSTLRSLRRPKRPKPNKGKRKISKRYLTLLMGRQQNYKLLRVLPQDRERRKRRRRKLRKLRQKNQSSQRQSKPNLRLPHNPNSHNKCKLDVNLEFQLRN